MAAFSINPDAEQAFNELHLLVVRNSKTPELLGDRSHWIGSLDEGLKTYSFCGQQRGCLGLSRSSPFLASMPFILLPLGYEHSSNRPHADTMHYHERTFELSFPLASGGGMEIFSSSTGKPIRTIPREAGRLIAVPPGQGHKTIRPPQAEPLSHPLNLVVALPGAAYDRIGGDRKLAELSSFANPEYERSDLQCGATRVTLFHQEGEGGVLLSYTELLPGKTLKIDTIPFRQEGSVSGVFALSDGETATEIAGTTKVGPKGNSLALLDGVTMSVTNRAVKPAKLVVVSALGHKRPFPAADEISEQFKVD